MNYFLGSINVRRDIENDENIINSEYFRILDRQSEIITIIVVTTEITREFRKFLNSINAYLIGTNSLTNVFEKKIIRYEPDLNVWICYQEETCYRFYSEI